MKVCLGKSYNVIPVYSTKWLGIRSEKKNVLTKPIPCPYLINMNFHVTTNGEIHLAIFTTKRHKEVEIKTPITLKFELHVKY